MSSIIGLSHIVFSVGDAPEVKLKSELLENQFKIGKYFELDHSAYRSKIIRNSINLISRLTFYESENADMPAIELLHVENGHQRNRHSFGFIFPKDRHDADKVEHTIYLNNDNYFLKCTIDEKLNSFVAHETNLLSEGQGCWITVNDFEKQRLFYLSITNAKILIDTEDLFVVKCRVVNRNFSFFTIVLIRGQQCGSETYNDDIGISTLGWITKDLNDENINCLFGNQSQIFPVFINKNRFCARFLFSNQGISHELLKIDKL